MVDQFFHAESMRRKLESDRQARKAKAQAKRLARIRAEGIEKTIRLDGNIGDQPGEFGAAWLRSELPTDGRPIRLIIHSEGGSVFEALAMHDLLSGYRGKVTGVVGSAAFSAASLLLTACDAVEGTANSFVMIHNSGFDDDSELSGSQQRLLDDLNETMVRLYSEKTGQRPETIRGMMAAETFLDASEATRLGFLDRVDSPKNLHIVARKLSRRVVARMKTTKTAAARWRAAIDAKCRTMPKAAALLAVDRENPGLRAAMLKEVNSKR